MYLSAIGQHFTKINAYSLVMDRKDVIYHLFIPEDKKMGFKPIFREYLGSILFCKIHHFTENRANSYNQSKKRICTTCRGQTELGVIADIPNILRLDSKIPSNYPRSACTRRRVGNSRCIRLKKNAELFVGYFMIY